MCACACVCACVSERERERERETERDVHLRGTWHVKTKLELTRKKKEKNAAQTESLPRPCGGKERHGCQK